MYREKLRRPEKWLPVGAGAILGGIALALLFPVAGHGAMAAEDLPTMTTGVNSNLTTLVRSSVAVALSSKVDLDVTPKSTGAFSTGGAELKVTTNNTTGYAVYMQTADNTSELKATNPHVDKSIAPVSGMITEGNFASSLNTWGYAIGSANSNTEYRAVPKAGDEAIVKTTGMSQEDNYDLSFAVAVGTDLPAGLYTNQIVVSVVANPIEVRSLNDINYMQDMTAEICAITFEGETKQLIDTRDGKSYWVAKLKDGNCWMTQELALTFGNGEGEVSKLTSNDSDLSSGREWIPNATNTEVTLNNSTNGIDSWKLKWNDGYYWYYQFNTATAGTGQYAEKDGVVGADGAEATDSICPKGWQLPLSGEMNDGKAGSFYGLFAAYGVPSDSTVILTKEPLNFVSRGRVWNNILGGSSDGAYWSRVVQSTQRAYRMHLRPTTLATPSGTEARGNGFTIRCVAR